MKFHSTAVPDYAHLNGFFAFSKSPEVRYGDVKHCGLQEWLRLQNLKIEIKSVYALPVT